MHSAWSLTFLSGVGHSQYIIILFSYQYHSIIDKRYCNMCNFVIVILVDLGFPHFCFFYFFHLFYFDFSRLVFEIYSRSSPSLYIYCVIDLCTDDVSQCQRSDNSLLTRLPF